MTSPAPLLEVEDLRVRFTTDDGVLTAVDGISFSVRPGETLGVVGESGSGKSVANMTILGLTRADNAAISGRVVFEGRDLNELGSEEIRSVRGNDIAMIFQDPLTSLHPFYKIGRQMVEAIQAHRPVGDREAKARAIELLHLAGIPDPERRFGEYPHEFSGGMRQRALIAIGLASRPRLLIADEPTSALDVTVQKKILDHLDGLTADLGTAVLFITHDLGLAAERAEHLVVMYKGKIVESGPAAQILQDPQHEYTKRLVSSAPSLASRRIQSVHERRRAADGSDAARQSVQADKAPDVVVAKDLTKVFSIRGARPGSHTDFTAVDSVDFALPKGNTLALVGESGSGKSTAANMVLGLLEPTSGTVSFDGKDLWKMSAKEQFKLRRRVQPVFQNPYGSLDPTFSIFRSIEEPLALHRVGSRKEREARVRELLDLVSLPQATMSRFPNELSGGQRQRIAIARALALKPEVLVLDEAVSALDVLVQAQILTLLNDLQAELGLSYLFITHDLAVVRQIADLVAVMKDGAVVEHATTDEVFDNPQQEYTRDLLAAIPGASLAIGG